MQEGNRITFTQAVADAAALPQSHRGGATLAEVLACPPRHADAPKDSRGYALRRVLPIADIVALVVAFVLAELIGGLHMRGANSFQHHLLLLGIAVPAWLLFARAHDLYHVDSRRADHRASEELAPIIWMTTLWSWSILLFFEVTGMRTVSASKLAIFWALTVLSLMTCRAIARAWARRQPWYLQNALVVGNEADSAMVASKVLRHPEYGINVVACVTPHSGNGNGSSKRSIASVGPVPVIRGEIDVPEIVDDLDVDRVILIGDGADLLEDLVDYELHVDIVPRWCEALGSRADMHELEGMPLITIPYARLARSSLVCKRAMDLVLSVAALIVLSPLLILCAVAIKLDSRGPVLFRQRRVGRHDKRFELLKFRSMRADADELKDHVADLNFHGGGNHSGMFKIQQDPRVTRVGRLLRRLSLDELPQLFNVVRGDMSMVGPRPLIENEDRQVDGRHRRRISLTPGLTGLWQVHGRSHIPFEEMIDLDYIYVTNWSLWGDVKLLLRTLPAVLKGQGAY
jgi:exopolysaccharide biosynthesis polyprenyl glycosylphosphotransferase